ncbi:helix-turn-helix domain-containing protein [Nocardia sp. NPDC051750]|uniref:helix-turn-helix domain-containing protein n=1 Tax=Nocardia sp. NPDC051750 TaxID=3364325 RepID=UPI00378EEBF9
MSESGSTLPRRQLGRYLRELRLQTGMTLAEAAQRIERSISTLQRLETGQCDRIRLIDVRELCGLYNADETETDGVLGLAQQASVKSWWHEFGNLIPDSFDVYMGLEAAACRLTAYAPDAVPGILQTPGYARALLHSALPEESSEGIEQRLRLKMKRHGLITRKRQPTELDVVVMQCALHRVVGGPKVMSPQLRYIADMSTRPNISVRVLPFEAGIPLGDPMNQFTVLSFGVDKRGTDVEPPVVYLESYTGEMYLEKPDDVQRYYEAQRALVDAALDENASRTLLRQVAKEFSS